MNSACSRSRSLRPTAIEFGAGTVASCWRASPKRDGCGGPWWSPMPSTPAASTCSACPARSTVFGEVEAGAGHAQVWRRRSRSPSAASPTSSSASAAAAPWTWPSWSRSCPAAADDCTRSSGRRRCDGRSVALVQVPTTSGTGSEAGTRALVTDPATQNKLAVQSRHMLADLAVVDPDLTMTVPPQITAATGVDALAHCVEAYTSRKAHPIDRSLCAGGHPAGRPLSAARGRATATTARPAPVCRWPRSTAASASGR